MERKKIKNNQHPEWGIFVIIQDKKDFFEIRGEAGVTVLFKDEFEKFWSIA